MACKTSTIKFFVLCIIGTLVTSYFLAILAMGGSFICNVQTADSEAKEVDNVRERQKLSSGHKLAVLVPYRDRFEELMVFIPHMQNFLKKQNIVNHVYVMNQVDSYRFNRASLINVGFELSMNDGCDYIVMHDVDLLPLNPNLSYEFPKNGPVHVAAPHLHPIYHYPTFVGGILILRRMDFEKVNGMSNKFWGWGLEDDDLYIRLRDAAFTITYPQNISTGIKDTFKHLHNTVHHKRDMAKCYNQITSIQKKDGQTGLSTLQYTLESHRKISVDGGDQVSLLDVKLYCNKTFTPWCECTPIPKTS